MTNQSITVKHLTLQNHISGIVQKGYEIAEETGSVCFDEAADAYMFLEHVKLTDDELKQIKTVFNRHFSR